MSSLEIPRVRTGIEGLDHMLKGGLPEGRSSLVSGPAGSGKTILLLQYLTRGVTDHGEAGVFVTFEERPGRLRVNARSIGFDIEQLEADGRLRLLDFTPSRQFEPEIVAGLFDFSGMLARLAHAISETGATRVAIDSIGSVFDRYQDSVTVRRELARLIDELDQLGVTTLMTTERTPFADIGRFGVEEYVTDNVIMLRNELTEEARRRTIELVKMRGIHHDTGEMPFTIVPGLGIDVITLSESDLTADSTMVRVPSGLDTLDEMTEGGIFRDALTLVSGATGTGKTLLMTEFITGGLEAGEPCLILGFEESRQQLFRNAHGWGRDFRAYEASGQLKVLCTYPETRSLEAHLVAIKSAVEEFGPQRVAIDSLSALERLAPVRSYREFLISLMSFLKHKQVACVMTATARNLLGGQSVTDAHVSTLTDMIILLRYVEIGGEIRRGLTVLKLRGSGHEKRIREYVVTSKGLEIGPPFRDVTGILSGAPSGPASSLLDEVQELFDDTYEE